jgi:uncharacterized protein YbaA (DUF1428 family)
MALYIDGYVIPLKKKKLNAYKKLLPLSRKVWMEHGALEYYECVGDDVNVKWGLPFPKLCKLKKDETVIFSFIVYKSKTDRNRINKKVMSDPRMQDLGEMPFDMKRFSMGGFKTLITTKRRK